MNGGFPWRLATVDIDGTLTLVHGWELFARQTGRLEAYRYTQERFFRHEIGEDEHLRNLLDLATGLAGADVARILAATPRLAGISEAVHELQRRGCKVALLTHNPRYVCDWYVREFGFDDSEGTDRTDLQGGRVAPPPPGTRADKAVGLDRLLKRLDRPRSATVHVGDGWADANIFPRVAGGVALNSRLQEVDAAADLRLKLSDLRPLVDALAGLRPRRWVNDGQAAAEGL